MRENLLTKRKNKEKREWKHKLKSPRVNGGLFVRLFVKKILSLLSVCFHQHLASKDWLVPVLRPSQITNTASFVSSSDLLKGAVTNIDAQDGGPF